MQDLRVDPGSAYCVAFTDWLACACAGANERAPRAVGAVGDDLITRVAFAGTAGHVLDYDDTFADGVAHVSAACAPAALVLAAHLGQTAGDALDAYAEGYEAMAAVAAASHPALYDVGWHPTAVLAPVGAVVTAARLLELTGAQREHALALAVMRAGGTRGAFGSDAKAIQVGLAAAAGVQAALLAREGASVDRRAIHGPLGFEAVIGATWALPDGGTPAIGRNWIKLHPSCLGTHSPIDAAAELRDREGALERERLRVLVDPVSRQAAHLDRVGDGLSAKFSIPYCVAYTLIHGPPGVRDFGAVDRRRPRAPARSPSRPTTRCRRSARSWSQAGASSRGWRPRGDRRRGRSRQRSSRRSCATWPGTGSPECSPTSTLPLPASSMRPGCEWPQRRRARA